MSICDPSTTTPHGTPRRLGFYLVLGGLVVAWGCASATVGENDTKLDGAAGNGSGGSGGGSGGSGGKGGSGGGGSSTGGSSGVCDPFTNAGCDGDNKCTAIQVDRALVIKCGSKGSLSEGDTCERTMTDSAQTGDTCGDKLACFSIGTSSPVCRQLCPLAGTANACPSSSACTLRVTGLTDIAFCQATTPCKPLAQSGCTSNSEACYYFASGALCAPKGATKPGSSCSKANDCEPNSTCLFVGSSGTCSSYCSTDSNGSPKCNGAATGGDICDPLPGGAAVEPNLGSCRSPST